MPPSSDRNLIFGLLALQMDFLSREQLLDAMHAWMLHKAKPLGDILCRCGILAEDENQFFSFARTGNASTGQSGSPMRTKGDQKYGCS
jgi:hypothetical protein